MPSYVIFTVNGIFGGIMSSISFTLSRNKIKKIAKTLITSKDKSIRPIIAPWKKPSDGCLPSCRRMISIAAKQKRSDSIRQAATIARVQNATVRDCTPYLIVSADTKNVILIFERPFNAPTLTRWSWSTRNSTSQSDSISSNFCPSHFFHLRKYQYLSFPLRPFERMTRQ